MNKGQTKVDERGTGSKSFDPPVHRHVPLEQLRGIFPVPARIVFQVKSKESTRRMRQMSMPSMIVEIIEQTSMLQCFHVYGFIMTDIKRKWKCLAVATTSPIDPSRLEVLCVTRIGSTLDIRNDPRFHVNQVWIANNVVHVRKANMAWLEPINESAIVTPSESSLGELKTWLYEDIRRTVMVNSMTGRGTKWIPLPSQWIEEKSGMNPLVHDESTQLAPANYPGGPRSLSSQQTQSNGEATGTANAPEVNVESKEENSEAN